MEDLYSDGSFEIESESAGCAEIITRLNRIEEKMRKVRGNGKSGGRKKLKKQLKTLRKEHEQLQYAVQQKPAWWQGAVTKALPNIVDFISVFLRNKK